MEIQKPTDIEIGFYEFYLKIQEPYENIANNPYYQVKLANKNIWNNDINANYLGNFQITEKSKNVENNSNKKSNVPIFFKLVICLLIILVVILLIRKFK